MNKKYVMYFHIETVKQTNEAVEKLPVITVIDNGRKKIIGGEIEAVTETIVEIVPYLGSDHSELIPLAVEVWEIGKSTSSSDYRQRKRQGGVA